MGVWGENSDQNDHAADCIAHIKDAFSLYADTKEYTDLEGQALADAQDSALIAEAPLLDGDFSRIHPGAILGFLREGYRWPACYLHDAEDALKAEKVEDAGWWDKGESRKRAIVKELELLKAALDNEGQLPEEMLKGAASAGLLETILGREGALDPKTHEEDEAPVAPLPQPFAWLDTAPVSMLIKIHKLLCIDVVPGTERAELVAAIKRHNERWLARLHAPYKTSKPKQNALHRLPEGAVRSGETSSGVPIWTFTDPKSKLVSSFYGHPGKEALGKTISACGNTVTNYEGRPWQEIKTRVLYVAEDITVHFKGPMNHEYRTKVVSKGVTIHYNGTTPFKEKMISRQKDDQIIHYTGECDKEAMQTIVFRSGEVEFYKGAKGEEHLHKFDSPTTGVTPYYGKKGEEKPVGGVDHWRAFRERRKHPRADDPTPAAAAPEPDKKKRRVVKK